MTFGRDFKVSVEARSAWRRRPARAAGGNCTGSAKTSPSGRPPSLPRPWGWSPRRQKSACRASAGTGLPAPASGHVLEDGLPTEAPVALAPNQERLRAGLAASSKIFAEKTTAPVLDPDCGRTKTGRRWSYAHDDRPWGGGGLPGVAYVHAPDRSKTRLREHLAGFRGVRQ